jgi:hemerythrin-like metal-binding protein
MASRVTWNPDFSVGNAALDGQHRDILARCVALADYIDAGDGDDGKFRARFDELMHCVREHFSTEEALLSDCGHPMLEEYRNERDEYEYLAAEIVTAENFDRQELQRFLVLWWVGHIVGFVRKFRAFPDK